MKNSRSSASRTAANRANAKKSTGPKTAEGKQAVSQNARRHGFTGARFFCPEVLRPLLTQIETEYRASLNPQGLLEEDAFLQLRNARFNMERAQILMDELGRKAAARGLDPLADSETGPQFLLYQRYFHQSQSTFHRYFRLVQQLQNDRVAREQLRQSGIDLPGLAQAGPVIRLLNAHERLLRQKGKREATGMENQARNILEDFLNEPIPGSSQSKPPIAS